MDKRENIMGRLHALQKQYPDFPVILMVDSNVITTSDGYGFYPAEIRDVTLDKYIKTEEGMVLYSRGDIDEVWNMYDYSYVRSYIHPDISEPEAEEVLRKLYREASWTDVIIIWGGAK